MKRLLQPLENSANIACSEFDASAHEAWNLAPIVIGGILIRVCESGSYSSVG